MNVLSYITLVSGFHIHALLTNAGAKPFVTYKHRCELKTWKMQRAFIFIFMSLLRECVSQQSGDGFPGENVASASGDGFLGENIANFYSVFGCVALKAPC